jgi:hypothetical protein
VFPGTLVIIILMHYGNGHFISAVAREASLSEYSQWAISFVQRDQNSHLNIEDTILQEIY